jgi:hypothetical protein
MKRGPAGASLRGFFTGPRAKQPTKGRGYLDIDIGVTSLLQA